MSNIQCSSIQHPNSSSCAVFDPVQHCFPASSVIGPARWCGRVFVSVTGVTGFSAGAGRRCRGGGPTIQQTSQFTASRFHSYLEETDHGPAPNQPRGQREKNNTFNAHI